MTLNQKKVIAFCWGPFHPCFHISIWSYQGPANLFQRKGKSIPGTESNPRGNLSFRIWEANRFWVSCLLLQTRISHLFLFFPHKMSDSEYFRCYRSHDLCSNYSIAFHLQNSWAVCKWVGGACANKISFAKSRGLWSWPASYCLPASTWNIFWCLGWEEEMETKESQG